MLCWCDRGKIVIIATIILVGQDTRSDQLSRKTVQGGVSGVILPFQFVLEVREDSTNDGRKGVIVTWGVCNDDIRCIK